MFGKAAQKTPAANRLRLTRPFEHVAGHAWMATVPWNALPGAGQLAGTAGTCLYEDGIPLEHGHASAKAVGTRGRGLFCHIERTIWFSSSDNTDPNTNGRRYEVDTNLDPVRWKQALLRTLTDVWDLHPEGAFFRSCGGDEIPPPLFMNMGLTNKCNLRCEICGSQKHLDLTGVQRRHMDLGRLEAVAATLFPLVAEVELNSQGDPILYPWIERVLDLIKQHHCSFKIQTNGTLFSERIVELLCRQSGTIMLSLDAVGARFDEVRRGGVWTRAQAGLDLLFRNRDPARQKIGIYPTVTRRTLTDAMAVASWAHDHDVDEVVFHRYVPIPNSTEEAPTRAELEDLERQLSAWARKQRTPVAIWLDGREISRLRQPRQTVDESSIKAGFAALVEAMMMPLEELESSSDPSTICVAPHHYVEIGLEGQISACCRAQDVNLGFATSPAAFANAWFGTNYRKIRRSLERKSTDRFPLPNCEPCIAAHAPKALCGRRAVDYAVHAQPGGLDYTGWSELPLEPIQREIGYCNIAMLPPGAVPIEYRLFEDDRRLESPDSLHDDIRQLGRGRYSLWGRAVYFSSTDNSDPRYNGRRYSLRRIPGSA